MTTSQLAEGYHRQCTDRLAADEIRYLAAASKSLRKEREFSFYGDVDFIPTDEYDHDDAAEAMEQARRAGRALGLALGR